MASVVLYFRDVRKTQWSWTWKPMYNYAVSFFIGPYTHCELAFRFEDGYQVFMLNIGHKAAFLPRSLDCYNSPQWSGYTVLLSSERAKRLWKACKRDVRNELNYDARVHCNLLLPERLRLQSNTNDATWCAQHVVTRVRQVNPKIFQDLDDTISPSALEQYCRNHPRYFRSISN